jgi:hypothetical protein
MKRNVKRDELQSRREFFKKAAKGVLPILSAIVLTSTPAILKAKDAAPQWCRFGCAGYCSNQCYSTCIGGCYVGCTGCVAFCKQQCIGCTGTCHATCLKSCSGSCHVLCASEEYSE